MVARNKNKNKQEKKMKRSALTLALLLSIVGCAHNPTAVYDKPVSSWDKDDWTAADNECRSRSNCAEDGWCTAVRPEWEKASEIGIGISCLAKTPENCKKSKICLEDGQCHLERRFSPGGYCFPYDNQDCRNSINCGKLGNCTKFVSKDGFHKWCAPSTNDDCRRSEICRTKKMCFAPKFEKGISECRKATFDEMTPEEKKVATKEANAAILKRLCKKFGKKACEDWKTVYGPEEGKK